MDLYKALGADPKARVRWTDLSAGDKRDVSEWVESAADREMRKGRIKKVCALLAAGRRCPGVSRPTEQNRRTPRSTRR